MSTATELERGTYFIYNNEPVRVLRKEVIVDVTRKLGQVIAKTNSKTTKLLSSI